MDNPTDIEWSGWYFNGRHLVSPHRDYLSPSLLNHLVMMHRLRVHWESGDGLRAQASRARAKRQKRLQGAQVAVKVVVVDLGAWRARHGLSVA